MLLVDEIYQGLVYGIEPWTALGLPGEVVVINSFSKYFCMTGWRLGWVVLPERALRGFEKLAQHLFISRAAPPRSTRPSPRSRRIRASDTGSAKGRVRPAARLPACRR